jgi:hypothetical protein
VNRPDENVPVDLQSDGVLWLINKVVFHPRGFALGHYPADGKFYLLGDGSESWMFTAELDSEKFPLVEALFERARSRNAICVGDHA